MTHRLSRALSGGVCNQLKLLTRSDAFAANFLSMFRSVQRLLVSVRLPFCQIAAIMIAIPPATADMRISGQAFAAVDASGHVEVHVEGCAEFSSDNFSCARLLTADSLVRVASISKLVTSLGVMRLVEDGILDLDKDISTYLGYQVRHPRFSHVPITLRLLLSHRSSLRDGTSFTIPLGADLKQSLDDAGRWHSNHAPGSHFHYENFNFVVVGTVMESVTGERFDLLMERLILAPLGINGCFNWASCSDDEANRATVLYRTGPDETAWSDIGPWVPQVDDLGGIRPDCPVLRKSSTDICDLSAYVPGTNGSLFSPHGGLRISVTDLAKIGGLLAQGGKWAGFRLLRSSTIDVMITPQWIVDAHSSNGDSVNGTFCAFGLSVQILNRTQSSSCNDDLFGDGRERFGHLAEAYGLYGGLWVDAPHKSASIYFVTGTSRDPKGDRGKVSAFTELEETSASRAR